MNPKVKSFYTAFLEGGLPYEANGDGSNGSKWFRIKHACGKDYQLYFNAQNTVVNRQGCTCSSVEEDIEQETGMPGWPWAGTVSKGDDNALKVIIPPSIQPGPDTFRLVPTSFSKVAQRPDHIFEYKNLKGETVCWITRYNSPVLEDGKRKKELHHYYLVETPEGPKFHMATNKAPVNIGKHMLYGLEHYDPARPTLFVEGEKTADIARQRLPKWNVLTWAYGKDSFKHNDFSFMRNTQAVIWPDNDEAGTKILEAFANRLAQYDIELKTVLDKPTNRFKEGWDLADELPNGVDLEDMINRATPVKQTVQSNEVIQELNTYIRRIQLGSTTDFVDIRADLSKDNGLFYRITKLSSMYTNYPWKIDVPGVKARQSVVTVWLEKINTPVLNGITFDPGTTEPIVGNKLNNFVGFPFKAVKPSRKTHHEMRKAYRLLCELIPNREQRAWVFDYAADIFQNPKRKPPTFLTFIGDQGVGKSLIVEVVRHVLGDHMYCAPTQIEEKVAFNNLESGTLLVYQDEIKISGFNAISVYDRLKSNITASMKAINRKGIAIVQEPSFERRMFTSNHDEPFRIAHDDRRTTIVRINPKHQGNSDAFLPFGAIKERTELAEALMWYFTKRRIKSNLKVGLASEEKADLVRDENAFIAKWYDVLNECELPEWLGKIFVEDDREKFGNVSQIVMGRGVFVAAVTDYIGYDGWATPKVKRTMNQMFSNTRVERQEGRFKYINDRGNKAPGQGTVFTFGTWKVMRASFDKHFGARKWRPIVKPHLIVDNTPEQQIL